MAAERHLLDTSAILTLIEDETGAGRVEEILRRGQALLPWVVLMEVYCISQQESDQATADRRYAALNELGAEILAQVPEAVLLTAARWKASHRLSFADALIAAYALHTGATLLHKDPEFEVLAGQVALEPLPYKGAGSPSPLPR